MSISGKVRPDIESVLSSVLFNVITLNVFPPNLNVFLTMMFSYMFGSTHQFIYLFILGLISLSCWDLNMALNVALSHLDPSTSSTLLQRTSLQERSLLLIPLLPILCSPFFLLIIWYLLPALLPHQGAVWSVVCISHLTGLMLKESILSLT
jgi:hypothetical protein